MRIISAAMLAAGCSASAQEVARNAQADSRAESMEVSASRPNFLIIQCDDLGVDDLGWNNPLVYTPTLDALAAESVRFTDFTVNPVCAPSRATFLTGRHFLRTGVSHVHGGKDFLHLDERTLGDHFLAAGYATAMWGKWHSGSTEGYLPWQRGFSEAWMADLYVHREARGRLNGQEMKTGRWSDEVLADYAIDFMRRNRSLPFLAYFSTLTQHSPHDAPERWVEFYRKRGCSEALARLWGMVSFLDEQIGRVLAELAVLGLSERTVVVFMSDNGPAIEQRALSDEDRAKRKVMGLRGWKGDLYENGVRSPLFIRWPAQFGPREEKVNTDLVDLAPTLLEMAGVKPLAGAPLMDGRSFLSGLLQTQPAVNAPTVINYAHRGWLTSGPAYSLDGLPGEYRPIASTERPDLSLAEQSLSIRQGNWKLILNPDYAATDAGPLRFLVDLAEDPREETNLCDKFPEIAAELENTLRGWWEQTKAEPHAFASPVFPLRPGTNRIPAGAPFQVVGSAFNTALELKGWLAPGDAATYRLVSPHAGEASLQVGWKGEVEVPAGAEWVIVVHETGERVPLELNASTTVRLPAGEFSLGIELVMKTSDEIIPSMRWLTLELLGE